MFVFLSECHIGLDIVIAIDGSTTVGEEGFYRIREFIRELVDSFNIGFSEDQTRFSVIQFSNEVTVEFELGDYLDDISLQKAVDEMKFIGGGMYTLLHSFRFLNYAQSLPISCTYSIGLHIANHQS